MEETHLLSGGCPPPGYTAIRIWGLFQGKQIENDENFTHHVVSTIQQRGRDHCCPSNEAGVALRMIRPSEETSHCRCLASLFQRL
jgi:hypothetical protein